MIRAFILLLYVAISHFALNAQHVFAINDFQATSDKLSVVGSAHYFEDMMRITPAKANVQGACWYKASQISLTNGFETEFNFLISGSSTEHGDGFAFVMQNQSPTALGGKGDAIGYKEIPFVMAIEFDTKNDGEGSKNHVNLSFYNPETKEYRRYATVHEIPEITDGNSHFTKVIYHDGELQVYLDSYIFPVLSVRIDIAAKVNAENGNVWVGFTSATSNAMSNHDLLQWTLREFVPKPEDIEVESIRVYDANAIQVTQRELRVKVWDHNTIDGDIISLKWGDQWILTDYVLTGEPYEIRITLHGFENSLILYANNVGLVPPNTAMISVSDGVSYFKQELNADLKTSEALVIQYRGKQ